MRFISAKKILLTGFMLVSIKSFSQNFNVQSAADSYKQLKYTNNRLKELTDAKRYIDLALANEQTSNDPKMWCYRGKIYLEIDGDSLEAVRNLDPDAIEKSAVGFINCIKTDAKKNYEQDCNDRIWVAGLKLFNKAVAALNKGDYEKAGRYFNLALDIVPLDKDNNLKKNTITADILAFNLAKTSLKSKDNEKAKGYLQKLIDSKYNDPMIYIYMSRACLEQKDTAKALAYIDQGRKLFDENTSLLSEEIRIYSLQGKFDVLISKFTDAININPDNEALYYNRASLYETKKDYDNAALDYKKAIEMNPDYFDANYYLGQMYFSQGAELSKEANAIKDNQEFEKAKKKVEQKLKDAEPYLEKAMDLNARKTDDAKDLYKRTLNSLKQLYIRTGEMEKYNKIKALLEQK